MSEKISRIDAENKYADLIIEKGNPAYFILNYLRGKVCNEDLEIMFLEIDQSCDYEIVDDE